MDARENDIIIVPPGYGHVTINAGNNDLIMTHGRHVSRASIWSMKQWGVPRFMNLPMAGSYKIRHTPLSWLQVVEAGQLLKVHFSKDGLYEMIRANAAHRNIQEAQVCGCFNESI